MKAIQLSVASLLLSTSAVAQALPDSEDLAERVSQSIPTYWSVVDFRLIAQTELGDAARPQTLIRFEADATPSSPLYAEVDSEDPFVIVAPTHGSDETRILYGVMDLSYRAGEWSGDTEIENPVDELGQPVDLFTRPTLVLGDPESEERLEQFRAQHEANAAARFEREMTALSNEHAAALEQLQAEQAAEVERMRSEHQGRLSQLNAAGQEERDAAIAEHETTMRRLAREHRDEISELRDGHAERMTALQAEHQEVERALETRVAELRAELEAQLESASAEHASSMEGLEREHSAAMADARARHEEAMETLERELRAELRDLTEGLEPRVEDARQEHRRTLAELEREHEAELEEMRVAHARARAELGERLNEELAAMETRLEREKESLEHRVEMSEAIVALQERLAQSAAAQQEGASRLLETFDEIRRERRNFFAALPDEWSGDMRCTPEGGAEPIASHRDAQSAWTR